MAGEDLFHREGVVDQATDVRFSQPARSNVIEPGSLMPNRPKIVALDVVETVFALESLDSRIRSAGLPEEALKLFFAQMLAPHPDVEPALDRLRAAGNRIARSTCTPRARPGLRPSRWRSSQPMPGRARRQARRSVRRMGQAPGPAIPAGDGGTRRARRNHARGSLRPALDARVTP